MQDLKKKCFKESEETQMAIVKQNVWLDKLSTYKDDMEAFPYILSLLFRDVRQGSAAKLYYMKSASSDPNIVACAREFAKAKLPPEVQVYYGKEKGEDDEFEDYEEDEINFGFYGEEKGVVLPEKGEGSADIIMVDIIQQEDDKLKQLLAKEGINEEALFF